MCSESYWSLCPQCLVQDLPYSSLSMSVCCRTELITTHGPSLGHWFSCVSITWKFVKTQITYWVPPQSLWFCTAPKCVFLTSFQEMWMLLVQGSLFENHCLGSLGEKETLNRALKDPQGTDKWEMLSLYIYYSTFTFQEMTHYTLLWVHDL